VKIAKRLGDAARTTVRTGRGLVGGSGAEGTEALYARILDGRHLWLAVVAEAGRPALWDEQAGREVEAVDDLTRHADHSEHGEGCVSVRWRLEEALPEREGAELLVVTMADDGPTPARHPARAGGDSLRIPPTPERKWRFALPASDDGLLRVRRTRAADVAVLEEIHHAGAGARLVCSTAQDGDVRLLFVDKEKGVVHSVPVQRVDGARCEVTLGADDLPSAPGGYRVALGTAEAHRNVVRRHNDLLVKDPSDVLLPMVLGGADDAEVAGRFQFAQEGVLRLVRRPPAEAT